MRRGVGALVLIVLCAPAVVRAQPDRAQRAQELYRDGQASYDAGKYDDAIAKWKEAYILSDEPLLLFNLGQAYRLKGDCDEARIHYESYLRRGTGMHSRDAIEATLVECEARPKETGEAPSETEAGSGSGSDSGSESGSGSVSGSVSGSGSGSVSGSPAEAPAAGGRKKAIGIALGGTGVVLTLTGVVFGVLARNDLDELEAAGGEWNDELQSLEDRQARNAVLAPVFIGAGLAAIAGGAVVYMLGRREAQLGAPAIAAAPTTDGGGIVVYAGAF